MKGITWVWHWIESNWEFDKMDEIRLQMRAYEEGFGVSNFGEDQKGEFIW